MMKRRKPIDLVSQYPGEISKFEMDSLLNTAVTSKFIYTKYNKGDIANFKKILLEFVKDNEFINSKDIEKFLKNIAQKATANSFTQVHFYENRGTFAGGSQNKLFLNKSEIEAITTESLAVINSFIADYQKQKVLDNLDKGEFIQRAEVIAKCETTKITNLAVTKVAKNEGFLHWVWGVSSSKDSRSVHEILYGIKSKIGETPAEAGEFPGELPNCKCKMIFVK
ncbi:hypothetical protein ABSA28_00541 [Candidatus Hepatincolaceae symbiont of Richtersius coronifer]